MQTTPTYIWEIGTAYDLFTSLVVLHQPDRYGLRGNWAAGTRSRLPQKKREFLALVNRARIRAIPWLVSLPLPHKDGASVLQALAQIPAAERLRCLTDHYLSEALKGILHGVAAQGAWREADKEALREAYRLEQQQEMRQRKHTDEELMAQLELWAAAPQFGEAYLAALEAYYDVFFREEEARIEPILQQTAVAAQELATKLPLSALLEELSQGLAFDTANLSQIKRLRLVPSFWSTPLALFIPLGVGQAEEWLFLFGGRPAHISLIPGEVVPDLLHGTLKALADPTRLRILRYLAAEPQTPAELARRLRLRPPTVIHHLDALRLARLVQLRLGPDGRRYAIRREAVKGLQQMLLEYLEE